METETATGSEFTNGRKAIVEEILVSEERKSPKRQDCESHSQLTICVRSFEIEKT